MFHGFTGCDTVSFFKGKGKKTLWQTWASMKNITSVFLALLDDLNSVTDNLSSLEHYVVVAYDKTSTEVEVNSARKVMFAQKGRDLERIPPTKSALLCHTKRAVLQASHCWNKLLEKMIPLQSPSDWGWHCDGEKFNPVWSDLPPVTETLSELLKCGCKKGCGGHCKCKKAYLPCTSLCRCDGNVRKIATKGRVH